VYQYIKEIASLLFFASSERTPHQLLATSKARTPNLVAIAADGDWL
jgi:hypothetical protein